MRQARFWLQVAFLAIIVLAASAIFLQGSTTAAIAMVCLSLFSSFPGLGDDESVSQLAWRDGVWYLCRADEWVQVEPTGYAVALPGWLHLVFGTGDKRNRYRVWLFTGSAHHEQLRRLRLRLRLEGYF